jgi:hypothetical protein
MDNKENLVKEKRLIEATAKNLTGLEGKIGQIIKYMGSPIISQTSNVYEQTSCYDIFPYMNVYDTPDEGNLPTEDMDTPLREIGRNLSALKWGINMELSYMKESKIQVKISEFYNKWIDVEKVMTVTYKGYVVYREIEGDLESYLPDDEWEASLDRIYESCKKLKKNAKIDMQEDNKAENKKDKLSLLARLRDKWGI